MELGRGPMEPKKDRFVKLPKSYRSAEEIGESSKIQIKIIVDLTKNRKLATRKILNHCF